MLEPEGAVGSNAGAVYIYFDGGWGPRPSTTPTSPSPAQAVEIAWVPPSPATETSTATASRMSSSRACTDDSFGTASGAVSIFLGLDDSADTLTADDRDTHLASNINYSEFGHAVEVIGDVNGDGRDDLLIGSPKDQHIRDRDRHRLPLPRACHQLRYRRQPSAQLRRCDLPRRRCPRLGRLRRRWTRRCGRRRLPLSLRSARRSTTDSPPMPGAVYLMLDPERTGSMSSTMRPTWCCTVPTQQDRIGESLSGEIDLDNDGVNDLIVGSPYAHYDTMGSGKAELPALWSADRPRRRCEQRIETGGKTALRTAPSKAWDPRGSPRGTRVMTLRAASASAWRRTPSARRAWTRLSVAGDGDSRRCLRWSGT